MTTHLEKPLAREVLLGDAPYKVVISPTGVRVTRKGHQRGVELSWDSIVALGETGAAVQRSEEEPRSSDLPQAIAGDVAREVRVATNALERARTALAKAGTVPAALLTEMEPDPVYGRVEHRSDWYVEPLLTVAEVSSILRLSRTAVPRLPIPAIHIGGERRYRQSELRRYLAHQEDQRSV